jgi:hypothetical protein
VLELDPNYAPGHEVCGWYLIELGRFDEGVNEGRRAEALDPLALDIALVRPGFRPILRPSIRRSR